MDELGNTEGPDFFFYYNYFLDAQNNNCNRMVQQISMEISAECRQETAPQQPTPADIKNRLLLYWTVPMYSYRNEGKKEEEESGHGHKKNKKNEKSFCRCRRNCSNLIGS